MKTALIAGVLLWIAPTALMLGFAKSSILTMGIWGKMLIPTLVNACAGAVAGAWAYREAT